VPGGRVEAGETDHRAVLREVAEETGLIVEVIRLLGNVQLPASDGAVFDVYDYICRPAGGTLSAGDDAEETRWCDAETLATLPSSADSSKPSPSGAPYPASPSRKGASSGGGAGAQSEFGQHVAGLLGVARLTQHVVASGYQLTR